MKGKYVMRMLALTALLALAGCGPATQATTPLVQEPSQPPEQLSGEAMETVLAPDESPAQPIQAPTTDMQPCTVLGFMPARCGTISVYENRAAASGRKIDLKITVIPAQGTDRAPDAVFYLAGGPGGAANDDISFARILLGEANSRRDLVFVDQRGTSGSHRLTCNTGAWGDSPEGDARAQGDLRACLDQLDGDPAAYTTGWSMDDLDDARAALGYERINLYGGSYGVTAGLVYIQRHGERVRSAVFTGGSLLEVPMFERMPASSQHALDLVFGRCEADPECRAAYPNVRAEFASIVERLDRGPIDLPLSDPATGQPVQFTRSSLSFNTHALLVDTQQHSLLPGLVHSIYAGNWGPIVAMAKSSQGSGEPGAVLLMMQVMINCHEDWAMMRRAETMEAAAGSYLRYEDVRDIVVREAVCEALPRPLPEALYGPLAPSDLPILFLSGEADPQDPEANVAGAKERYPNSLVLVAPGQAHNYTGIPCRTSIIAAFFDAGSGQALDSRCLAEVPLPQFEVVQ